MTCTSILEYSKSCGKGIAGGVGKLFLIAYQDLTNPVGSLANFALSTNGMINEIGLLDGKKFVNVGILRNTVNVAESAIKDPSVGSFDINTTMTLVISNITDESRSFVDSIMQGEVAAIVKLRSGKYVALGLSGFLEVTQVDGGSGTSGADLNGYTITLTGVEDELMRLVDPTIIATITDSV